MTSREPDSKVRTTTELPSVRQAMAWLVPAAAIAFAVPASFSMGLRWERSLFLVPYIGTIGALLFVFVRRHPVSMKQPIGSRPYALVGIAVASFLPLKKIGGQPSPAVPSGMDLVTALACVVGRACCVIMHVAAVLHGMETALQLQPHYGM